MQAVSKMFYFSIYFFRRRKISLCKLCCVSGHFLSHLLGLTIYSDVASLACPQFVGWLVRIHEIIRAMATLNLNFIASCESFWMKMFKMSFDEILELVIFVQFLEAIWHIHITQIWALAVQPPPSWKYWWMLCKTTIV